MTAGRCTLAAGALLLAACGQLPGGNNALADATEQRPLPCSVQALSVGPGEAELRHKPERPPCDDSVDPERLALDELIRTVPDQHPAAYYILATRLFEAGRRDEAVFWFYAGQLRYRIRLACHPDLPPSTEPALFASLQESAGRPINEYGAGDPDAWTGAMQRALDWDQATRNGFEPKAPCAAQIADQRGGLGELIRQVRENKEQLRRERAANGLPNR